MSDSFATPWTVPNQPHLFMGFPRQEYWNGLLFPSPRDIHDSGIKFTSVAFPALAGVFFTTEPPGSSVQSLSHVQLCDQMDCSTSGLPDHHQLPESTQTHVHWVGDAIQPSHPLTSPSPPALNLLQHQGLFKSVSSSYQVAKVLEFQLQHQSF